MLTMLNMTEDEVWKRAEENTKRYFRVQSFTETMTISIPGLTELPCNDHILTNKYKLYGAGVIALPELLQAAAITMGASRIYIIPSSIHELIIVDADKAEATGLSVDNLLAVNMEINATECDSSIVLTSNIYEYDTVTKEILMKK